ncbi:TonB-dependent receptor plug domain-containing protein [Vulcaniibacterium tengchongense]|uniref:TonB-dependent receptor-like protein n=1 Tax=Vulcaniibacterium tengchongense TaxID=1273429 RepID=A0A3N4W6X3_9GAMM|nr:TonB-dependent receptor [Vulcaniibacterium tengchongense]RPE80954.1 TonB-dependent receptor-like protein [Vulcaniibacterium tengchongense]
MTLKTTQLRDAIKLAIAVGAGVLASTALAQEAQQEEATTLDRVEVTGTRIKRVDAETASPVFVIDRQAIEASGVVTIGEFLQTTPAVAGAATNPQVNNGGGGGAATMDLRGLGPNRTLVLVDGRRWIGSVANAGSAVDVNSIPMALVERVEVLKDGASAIYGSDAIGGVVNFILRREFEGLEVSAMTGVSSRGDADTVRYEAMWGASSEKGRIMFGASYDDIGEVAAADRPFSSQPFQLYNGEQTIGGTSRILTGYYLLPRAAAAAAGADLSDPACGNQADVVLTRREGTSGASGSDFRCYNPLVDVYNFQADGNLNLTPQEHLSLFVNGSYDLGDFAEAFLVGAWNKTQSKFQIAPLPFDGRPGVDNVPISADSMYNPFGVDITDARLRLRGFIPTRQTSFETDTYQFTMGLRGDIGDSSWSWDAYYTYGRTPQTQTVSGYLYAPALTAALGPSMIDPATGSPICVSTPGDPTTAIPGCLPVNFFGPAPDPSTPEGQAQLEALRLINPTIINKNENELQVYSVNATGDLFDMPAGPLGLAVGLEHRRESATSTSDFLTIIPPGETTCLIAQEACTFGDINGRFDVTEAYLEALIPLLADVPFAQRLSLSLGVRYSDYSNFGENTSYKGGLEWKPIDDLLVRATYANPFRAPTVAELFSPTVPSAQTYIDPCNDFTGAPPGSPQAGACVNVPTDGSFEQSNNQTTSFQLSNPDLGPEKAKVQTLGFVYSPAWLEGFSTTVDLWKVKIEDFITIVPEQTVINQCFDFGRFCDQINRDSRGDIVSMVNPIGNFGVIEAKGVDVGFRYNFPETSWGRFTWSLDTSYLAEFEGEFLEGDPTTRIGVFPGSYGLAGTFQDNATNGFGNFARWRALNDLRWSKGDFSASVTTRYVHHVDENPADTGDPDDPNYVTRRTVPAWAKTDVQVAYRFGDETWQSRVELGVRNVFDRLAPLVYSGFNGSTDMRTYDAVGRFFWMRYTARF